MCRDRLLLFGIVAKLIASISSARKAEKVAQGGQTSAKTGSLFYLTCRSIVYLAMFIFETVFNQKIKVRCFASWHIFKQEYTRNRSEKTNILLSFIVRCSSRQNWTIFNYHFILSVLEYWWRKTFTAKVYKIVPWTIYFWCYNGWGLSIKKRKKMKSIAFEAERKWKV